MVLLLFSVCGIIVVQSKSIPHKKGFSLMSYQLHLRLNSQLLTWVIKKAKAENRTINNCVVNILMNLKKEEENAFMGVKASQSINMIK